MIDRHVLRYMFMALVIAGILLNLLGLLYISKQPEATLNLVYLNGVLFLAGGLMWLIWRFNK